MRSRTEYWGAAMALLALTSCGMVDGRADRGLGSLPPAGGSTATKAGAVADWPVKIGEAYQVQGKTYVPADTLNYDEVGYASWYGDELRSAPTANGEIFNPDAISAAHRTLPLPSYIEVTSLDTGKTILVRVNDRGPFAGDRLLDLSQGAARQLGISGMGHAPVRVRRVNPPEQERAVLRNGGMAAERIESPKPLLGALRKQLGAQPLAIAAAQPVKTRPTKKPPAPKAVASQGAVAIKPVLAPGQAAAQGRWYVQLGAFASQERADALARRAAARSDPAGKVYRVRYGPFASEGEAKEALRSANAKGYREARVLRDAGG